MQARLVGQILANCSPFITKIIFVVDIFTVHILLAQLESFIVDVAIRANETRSDVLRLQERRVSCGVPCNGR